MSNPSKQPLPIRIREMKPGDFAFLANSFKRSLRDYSPELTTSAYFALANSVFDEIMSGFPAVYVACSPEDEDVILSYLIAEATPAALVLWMAYTVRPYRRENIAGRLLAKAMDELDDAGPETVYCPIGTRIDGWLKERLGAGQMSWAKAIRLRGRAA